jgi:hypothetical protein
VITSRPQGYRDAPLQHAHISEVQPFTARQVRQFVENWYCANEIVASGNQENARVRQKASSEAEDLLRRLHTNPTLSALTVNPLLLTMIAMVHRYHGALPGSRVELYKEICEVLLGRWRQARGVHDRLTAAQKRVVLEPLAAEMMQRHIRDISTEEAGQVIGLRLESVGVTDVEAQNALRDFQASSGLLLEREAERWSFAHLTFQEYLTAAHWLEEKDDVSNWDDLVKDSWWHETLRLYAAQGDATPVVRACLAADTVPALTLAAECLEEARKLDPALRRAVNERVMADLTSSDPARRHLAAEVQLSRRLKSLQRIDDQREIDLTYITCAEYQLFLDDQREQEQYHQPDHWVDYCFAPSQAREPISGVRPEDADAFCAWLTQRQGGTWHYRLPTTSEARGWQTEVTHLAAWSNNEGNFCLVFSEPLNEQIIKQQISKLSNGSVPLPPLCTHAPVSAPVSAYIRASANAYGRTFASALGHILVCDYIFPFALDLARTSAHTRARVLDPARTNNHTYPCTPDLTFAFALDLALDLVCSKFISRALIREHDHTLTSARGPIADAIRRNDLSGVQRLAVVLEHEVDISLARLGRVLNALLTIARAETVLELRQAQKQYMSLVLEDMYTLGTNELWPMWRWLYKIRPWLDSPADKRTVSDAYWWVQIVRAREAGQLLAWEGIRIVREQVQVYADRQQ